MNSRIRSMLGLCMKAGKVVSGEFACEKTLQAGKGKLIIVAADASDNTKEKFMNKSKFYHIPVLFFSSKEEFGAALGKEIRATAVVMDDNFAAKIQTLIEEEEKTDGGGQFA